MRNLWVIILGLFSMVLVACGGSTDPDMGPIQSESLERVEVLFDKSSPSEYPDVSSELLINKIERIVGGFEATGDVNLVIKNASDWSIFWEDYLIASGLSDPLPVVDFSKNTVVVTQRLSKCDLADFIGMITRAFGSDRFQTELSITRNGTGLQALNRDCNNRTTSYWTIHAVSLVNEVVSEELTYVDWEQPVMGFPTAD